MRRVLTAVLLVGLLAAPAGAQETTVDIATLLADPAAFTEAEAGPIVVVGELVGDYGRRDGAVWTQLNGDSYVGDPILLGGQLTGANLGIGVRIPADQFPVARSDTPGGYRHRGPIVRVTGLWRFHDPDRGGESYLEALDVELVEHEQPLSEGVRPVLLVLGVLLTAAGGALWVVDRRRARFV